MIVISMLLYIYFIDCLIRNNTQKTHSLRDEVFKKEIPNGLLRRGISCKLSLLYYFT